MTAAEATALAKKRIQNKALTPDKLAAWLRKIDKLIEAEALDGKFTLNLGGWLCSRSDIERDGHLPALLDALKANGFGVFMPSHLMTPTLTWLPQDERREYQTCAGRVSMLEVVAKVVGDEIIISDRINTISVSLKTAIELQNQLPGLIAILKE